LTRGPLTEARTARPLGGAPREEECPVYRTLTETLFSWVNSRITAKPISRP